MKRISIIAGVIAAAGAVGAGVARSARRPSPYVVGTLANGMEETRFGDGDKTLLWIPDPTHTSPTAPYLRFMTKAVAPFVRAGYCVHLVARKPHLAADVTANDLATDYADLIESHFAGRVDLVVADSQGGVIGYCLAALRPDLCQSLATVAASHSLNPAARDATVESARLLSQDRRTDAAASMVGVQFPQLRARWLVRLAATVIGRVSLPSEYDRKDVLAAAKAVNDSEVANILHDISVPVLIVCGDSDHFASLELYEETARLIPNSRLAVYEGKGHLGTISDERLAWDILEFDRRSRSSRP